MVLVAKGVHANRIIEGRAIVTPVGNPGLPPKREKEWRRKLIENALDALRSELD
jgi:glycine reductase